MENKQFEISLKCLFCDCELQGDTEKEYSSGDMLECQECGELNDYDALIDVAADEGREVAAKYVNEEIEKMLKKAFK
ncbi:hypothetical protein PUND_a1227 [Pseudoalteromonas undina]|uniref:Uncharacterized protein n=1 Tax=Pseudoalteromonas undina TaxID=43660 RepID=A0ABP2XVH9_9GAMM|nr:hypothetical protein [Pseudoalteromonas undina]KAF7765531.1 hypothetical protein PUND_a1227 [Pseudoalteromonas undina]